MGYNICYVYIDGEYVRQGIQQMGLSGEFDPTVLYWPIARQNVMDLPMRAGRYFVYDAFDPNNPAHADRQAYLRHIEQLEDVTVRTGYMRRSSRAHRRQQKGVDVQLAVDALEAARSGSIGVVALVTGDGDFAPLVEAVQRAGPHIFVFGFKESIADELREVADRVRFLEDIPEPLVLLNWPPAS